MPEGEGVERDEDGFVRAYRYLGNATKVFLLLALVALVAGAVCAVLLFMGHLGGQEWR